MFTCKVCGGVVEAGMAFCPTCGADVVQNYEVLCQSCGTKNAAGSRFCAKCGSILDTLRKPHCSICGAVNLPGAKFCISCGAPIIPETDTHSGDDIVAMQKAKRTIDMMQKERLEAVDKEVETKRRKLLEVKDAALKEVAEKTKAADEELNKKAEMLDEYRRKLNELGPEDVAQLKKLSIALKTYSAYYADPFSVIDEDNIDGETYVCPACGTINPSDVPACAHCGRSKARSVVLLKKEKIRQAKPVKRQNRVLPAPETDIEPELTPTFDEYAQGGFNKVEVEISSPEEEKEVKKQDPQQFVPRMPYGMPGKVGAPGYGYGNYGGFGGYGGSIGAQGATFYNTQTGEPYQMPPILQPVAFVPYVTQDQPLMQYSPDEELVVKKPAAQKPMQAPIVKQPPQKRK